MTDKPRKEDALSLPPMSRSMQRFSLLIVFLTAVVLTWFVVANPLGLGFLPSRHGGEAPVASAEPQKPAVLYSCPICNMPLVEMKGAAPSTADEPGVLYSCPMHPEVIENAPGSCPICNMPLVEMKQSAAAEVQPASGSGPGVIKIDPVQVQNIGVVSVEARTEDIARRSRTVGILDFNANRITWINTKFSGWIEKAHVNYVGQEVRRGRPLFEIYSPELVTTQEEYLRALDYRASLEGSGRPETVRQAESLVRSSRERLEYWDIAVDQIERLERTRETQRRLTVRSPADGVVASVMSEALEGMYVQPGMDLYKIADLSTVWVHADIYEADMPWIREGQPAIVTFRQDPGRTIRGKVLFLYPEVSSETRTLKICVEVPNKDRRLRPGMYADVTIEGPPVAGAVVIPQSAVIRSGERDIVFLDLGEGRFEPREVRLGVRGERDRVQVLAGVTAGDAVVTQAQFMLDSESRIQEAIAKFRQRRGARDAAKSAETPQHVH